MRLLYLSLCFSLGLTTLSCCQGLKFYKSTEQTMHHGISPSASVNYLLYFRKKAGYELKIDSVITVTDKKSLGFTIFRKNEEGNYIFTPEHTIKSPESGSYHLSFGIVKSLGEGSGKPPEEGEVLPPPPPPAPDVSKGFTIHYTLKGKKKFMVVNSFQKLENLDAP